MEIVYSDKNFRCRLCNPELEFDKWTKCSSHIYKFHHIAVGLLKCPLCNFRAQIATKIYRHLNTHSDVKQFQCGYCKKRFSRLQNLETHVESHDFQKEEKLKQSRWYNKKTCKICHHSFANSKTLSKHVKQVHNKIKPFICKICEYSAARKSTITIHERQHTGEKPLQCKIDSCTFRAADPSVLLKHIRKHKSEEFSSSYKCLTCSYTAIQASALKNHIRVKHSEVYDKKIKCDACEFTSVNENVLRNHKLDHTSGLINLSTEKHLSVSLLMHNNAPVDVSSDSFLPHESTDSDDPIIFSGGVTIPALIEDALFPTEYK